MRIKAENTAILVIDYQERLVPAMHNSDDLIKKSTMLLKGMAVLGVPAIVSQQYPKGLGQTIPEITEALGENVVLDKTSFSVCQDDALMAALRICGKSNIAICGMEAHVCVLQSLIDLKALGFEPILVADCISSRNPYDKEVAITRAIQEGAAITTAEALLFELTEGAGNKNFKAISKLVK